jgi:hypothetical protein
MVRTSRPTHRRPSSDDRKPSLKFLIFRGNGSSYLHRAFERRFPSWQPVMAQPLGTSKAGDARQPLTKLQENLLLSKALMEGGVAFVFRDLFSGPHWDDYESRDLDDANLKYNSSSLFSSRYPAIVNLEGGKQPCKQPQVVNRWPHHSGLTNKDESLKSLQRYYDMQGLSPWDYLPLSFIVPNCRIQGALASKSAKWRCACDAHASVGQGIDARVPASGCKMNLWLLKPSNGSGGDGIVISSDIHELERAINTAKVSTQSFIFQKYLETPLLFHGRKFDLRVWAVLADDPKSPLGLRVYAYREGYARTSSELFDLSSREVSSVAGGTEEAAARHRLVHLTNYCQQIQGNNCSKYEEGNTASFDDIQASMDPESGCRLREDVLPNVYALVADAVLAARKELVRGLHDYGNGRRVVALLGYDFMISASGQPFLIEVNANPLLAPQNQWHDLLVSRMVDDYVQLAGDATFQAEPPPSRRPPLDGEHCQDFGGCGFILLVGQPTDIHPMARFEVSTVTDEKGEKAYVLDRTGAQPDLAVMVQTQAVDLVEAQPPRKVAKSPIQSPLKPINELLPMQLTQTSTEQAPTDVTAPDVSSSARSSTPKRNSAPRWMAGTSSSTSRNRFSPPPRVLSPPRV